MSKLKLKYPETQHYSTTDDDLDTDDQSDIIRCVCHNTTDDGFTIQCESCDTWQHAKCVNIKKKAIPEHYICERCKKKKKKKPIRRRSSSETEDIRDRKKKLVKRVDSGSDEDKRKASFIPISKSVMKEKLVEDLFLEVHRQWIELNWPKAASGSKRHASSSISPNKCLDSIIVMESNLLLPAIPKASVKPIRKSLRGSFSFHSQNDPSIPKGIFADIHIPKSRYLMEVTGEALRKSEYKADTRNKFNLLGAPLPRVFFYPSLDICIDSRYTGNETRFIRRSCCPNSELKSIILPNDNEDHTIHMGIYTKDEVDKGEEITIGWNWHRGQLMWKKNKEFKDGHVADIMNDSEKELIRETLDLIDSEFGKCACEDEEDCLLEYLKEELERKNTVKKTKQKIPKPRKSASAYTNIFTSDEEDEIKPAISEKKRVQFVDKSAKASIPTSPAISVDIDVTTMSPTPNPSENELDLTSGSKRTRPTSATIKLPCKKRWLFKYISQQQSLEASPPKLKTPIIYERADASDGASSESTLPLDNTHQINKEHEAINSPAAPEPIANVTNTQTSDSENPPSKDDMAKSIEHVYQEMSSVSQPSVDIDNIGSEQSLPTVKNEAVSHKPTVVDEVPVAETLTGPEQKCKENAAPKVKLSIQEYLKRQRGNLPTPDENNN
ncbi:uncharacterized protein EV154DRAFT_606159 [Mucor mucedo]|uniref:uncharacterized protein n=1 Tax=Mucor mucedo TaxID=29922 RepID=UPI00221EA89B|nr:uncharacterized protein EV154DRAFT_606159 [Mucor mucedo]KAI7881528.1 hypothetical protein EV154DRAFT_606159 [Mucor mucedo]